MAEREKERCYRCLPRDYDDRRLEALKERWCDRCEDYTLWVRIVDDDEGEVV